VPVGVEPELGVTFAVRVADCPTATLEGVEMVVVVEIGPAAATVTVTALEVELPKEELPP